MGSWAEKMDWIEETLSPISKPLNTFFFDRVNLGVFTCSNALFALICFLPQIILSDSLHQWKKIVITVLCACYIHVIVAMVCSNIKLDRNDSSNPRTFQYLYGVVKVILQTSVMKLLFLLGELFESVRDAPTLMIFTCLFLFIHLIMLSRYFYILEDFGLIDGVCSLFFSLLTHLYRGPSEQLLILLISSAVMMVLNLRYSVCCEHKQRVREEAEKKRVAEEEERKRLEDENEIKRLTEQANERQRLLDEQAEKERVAEEEERKRQLEEQAKQSAPTEKLDSEGNTVLTDSSHAG